jgi:ubiquinone/menaquinone biosynthesis C-methylase UbiE
MKARVDTARWITSLPKLPGDVEQEYDKISTCYDNDLLGKGYRAPKDGSRLLANFVPTNTKVLDVGCGTGLMGFYLNNYGFTEITGMDISANCLNQAARKGVYTNLIKHNILKTFPFEDNTFDAVACIGVFSRFNDSEILSLVVEFNRVVKPEGVILISHREDLLRSSAIIKLFGIHLHRELKIETVTDPSPYIPQDKNYENINVQYIVLRKINGTISGFSDVETKKIL